jgi:hypothetical protein
MAFHFSPKIVTEGLVFMMDAANLRSYPGTGTTLTDMISDLPIPFAGTATFPSFDPDDMGSIFFDNPLNPTGNYSHVRVNDMGDSPIGNVLTAMTLEVFFKPNGNGNTSQFLIRAGGGNDQRYGIGYVRASGTVKFNYKNQTTGNFTSTAVSATDAITLNKWNQACCTIDESGNVVTYVNGIASGTGTVNLSDLQTLNTNSDLGIGGTTGNTGQWLGGRISIVKIYNRGLSADEVLQNYSAFKSRYGL